MGIFRVPNFKPGYNTGTQIFNPASGGPSGGAAGWPKIALSRVPRIGPNGNATSMNGAGGYISGFMGAHWTGPASIVPPGPQPYANEYAFANQKLYIPGIMKNPAAGS